MLMRGGPIPNVGIKLDTGRMVAEAGSMALGAANRAISQNPEIAAFAGFTVAITTLLAFTVRRGVTQMAPPSPITESSERGSNTGPANLTDSSVLPLLTDTDPEVLKAVAALRALHLDQRQQVLALTKQAAEVGLDAATGFIQQNGEAPVDPPNNHSDSDKEHPITGTDARPQPSTPTRGITDPVAFTPKTPVQVLLATNRLLTKALTPENLSGRDPFSSSRPTQPPQLYLEPSTSSGQLGGGLPQAPLTTHRDRGGSANPSHPLITPQPPRKQSRLRQGEMSKSSNTPPPLASSGPSRAIIVSLTFIGVSLFAYTMAYGLPSFGKIKGWAGAAA